MSSKPARFQGKRLPVAGCWILAVAIFASQWYLYDAIHNHAERLRYYLATSAYLWGVLTPLVLWLAHRNPIDSSSWKRALPLHLVASLFLTGIGIFGEVSISWLPHATRWQFSEALRHYFTQHMQIGLVAYWTLLAAAHIYRIYDQARQRELHAAQLEAQLAEAQLSALRTQLQPHFLFNTLQAATMLIYDDPQGAEEILLSLSELLRLSLEALRQQEVPLSREIEFLDHYAAIQQRRFGDRLRFECKIDKGLDGCAVPSLVLQPLVENAIRHGIGKHKEPDIVSVRANANRNRLILEVRNQTSFLEDTPDRLFLRGVGLANTAARLDQLYGLKQSFAIRNLQPRGVEVSLSIPLHWIAERKPELVEETAR
jgi:two-component system, LytTR family, sensor kinase